jgi:hypothetical protein
MEDCLELSECGAFLPAMGFGCTQSTSEGFEGRVGDRLTRL